MKRFKFVVSCAVVMALALTACDDTNFDLVPTESTIETEVTVTEIDETVETVLSPTPTVVPGTTVATGNDTEPDVTETDETADNGSSGGENSGSGSPGGSGGSDGGSGGGTSSGSSSGGSASGSGEIGSGSSSGGSSSGGSGSDATSAPEPTETSVAKPTETTSSKYDQKFPCDYCGQYKVYTDNHYHYTTPEKTHEETTETWDYGIQHCTVQINWNSYAKELGDPPSIKISFDRKVDTSGKPYDNGAEKDATNQAIGKANEWLNGMGVSDYGHYYSYQTNSGSTDKINYNKTTTTVVDEPAHEYEVVAEVCDGCGHVTYIGTPKQIK